MVYESVRAPWSARETGQWWGKPEKGVKGQREDQSQQGRDAGTEVKGGMFALRWTHSQETRVAEK